MSRLLPEQRESTKLPLLKNVSSRLQSPLSPNLMVSTEASWWNILKLKMHNSWLYCFTNPLELGTRVSPRVVYVFKHLYYVEVNSSNFFIALFWVALPFDNSRHQKFSKLNNQRVTNRLQSLLPSVNDKCNYILSEKESVGSWWNIFT